MGLVGSDITDEAKTSVESSPMGGTNVGMGYVGDSGLLHFAFSLSVRELGLLCCIGTYGDEMAP